MPDIDQRGSAMLMMWQGLDLGTELAASDLQFDVKEGLAFMPKMELDHKLSVKQSC